MFFIQLHQIITVSYTHLGKWYAFDEDGLKVKSGFLEWNGKYYWAQKDADGELARDGIFMTDNGKYAVFNASCEQVVNGFYKTTSGKTYYQDASTEYRIATGKKTINGKIYLFNDNGELQTSEGWVTAPEGTYYLKADGTLAAGPMQIGGKWYAFDKNGLKVESGWLEWNGKYYWAQKDANGELAREDVYKRQVPVPQNSCCFHFPASTQPRSCDVFSMVFTSNRPRIPQLTTLSLIHI